MPAWRDDLLLEEIVARYAAGDSTRAIARVTGTGHTTIRHRLLGAGVKMRPRNQYKRGGPLHLVHGHLATYDREHRCCYIHRACWEAHHGLIPEGHDVHHTNWDRLDNDASNLLCLPHSQHVRLHMFRRYGNEQALRALIAQCQNVKPASTRREKGN